MKIWPMTITAAVLANAPIIFTKLDLKYIKFQKLTFLVLSQTWIFYLFNQQKVLALANLWLNLYKEQIEWYYDYFVDHKSVKRKQ